MVNKQRKVQHLFLRAGFGESPLKVQQLTGKSRAELVQNLFIDSKPVNSLKELRNPVRGNEASNLKIALLILRSKEQVKSLNLAWLEKMANERAQLREKMTLFWHGHFATKIPFAYLMQVQNNTDFYDRHSCCKSMNGFSLLKELPSLTIMLSSIIPDV